MTRARTRFSTLLASLVLGAGPPSPAVAASPDLSCSPAELAGTGLSGPARLLPGMGSYRLATVSASTEAQRFFDQGVVLAFGFNFAEAIRSFTEAARLDPQCALCRWGIAWARGPSVNHDMTATDAQAAFEASSLAQSLAPRAAPPERALIAALAKRYANRADAPRGPYDDAYADAMRALARAHPDDADILTLAAEALMVPNGRDYWTQDGKMHPWTPEPAALLERAMKLAPNHPGALHYWIHLHEFGPEPQKAVAAAERIGALAPGAGHLVHMPAHTFARVGRYEDAVAANRRAVQADLDYLRAAGADPAYASGYIAHNYHFLWWSALMAGDETNGMLAAGVLSAGAAAQDFSGPAGATQQHFRVLPLHTLVRFGKWEAILAERRPTPATAYTDGVWHWARGMALARQGKSREASIELAAARKAGRDPALARQAFKSTNSLASLLAVANGMLAAEVAAASGRFGEAEKLARAAVKAEDALQEDEPPAWHAPTRQTLGAVLLAAGRKPAAARAFREDLARLPGNGWSTAGLAAAEGRLPAGKFPAGRF